eukprot:138302-Rhodomonas_salina.1
MVSIYYYGFTVEEAGCTTSELQHKPKNKSLAGRHLGRLRQHPGTVAAISPGLSHRSLALTL